MITYKLNKLGLAYKTHLYNINQTVFEINIPESNYTFTLQKIQSKDNSFDIDWGDASGNSYKHNGYFNRMQIVETYTNYTNTTSCSHIYKTAGRYVIKLKNIKYFNIAESNRTNITGIYQFGLDLTSADNLFKGCTNLSYLHKDLRISKNIKSCEMTFAGCTSIKRLPTYLFYTYKNNLDNDTTDKKYFEEYNQLNRPITLAAVSSFMGMFSGCTGLQRLHSSFLLTNNAENIDSMFEGCSGLTTIGNTFTVPSSCIEHANNVFKDCHSLKTIPNTLTLTNVQNSVSGFFENCSSLIDIPNTFSLNSNIKNIDHIFKNCYNINTISENISFGYSLSSAIEAFYNCSSIIEFSEELIKTTPSTIVTLSSTFENCFNLTKIPSGLTLKDINTNICLDKTFKNCNKLVFENTFELPLSAASCIETFAYCYEIKTPYEGIFLPASVNYSGMFRNCINLTNFTNENIQLYNEAKDISCIFENCSSLIQISNTFKFPDTLTNCASAFYNCKNLNWDWHTNSPWPAWTETQELVSNETVINISGGFTAYDSTSSTIDINFIEMFYNCRDIKGTAPGQILWKLSIESYPENLISGTMSGLIPDYAGTDCFKNCISLDNYALIPIGWGGLGKPEFGPYWATLEYTITQPSTTIQINQVIPKNNINGEPFDYFYINWNNNIILTGDLPSADFTNEPTEKISTLNNISYTYEKPGIYYITLQQIGSFKVGENTQLTDILFLGNKLNTCEECISGSKGLITLKYPIALPKNAKNFNSMFKDCTNLSGLSDNLILSRSAQTVSSMFEGCSNLTYIPSSFVLTDNIITNCENMFKDCFSLEQLEETFLLPSTTTSFRGMFDNCTSLSAVPTEFSLFDNTEDIAYMFRNTAIKEFPTGVTLLSSIRDASEAFENMPNLEMNISSLIHTEFANTRNIDFYMTFKNTSGLFGEIPTNILWDSELHFTSRQCFKGCLGLAQEYENTEQKNLMHIPINWGGEGPIVFHPDESVFTSCASANTQITFNSLSAMGSDKIDNYTSGTAIFIDWGYNTNFNDLRYTPTQDMEEDAWIRIYNTTYFNTSSLMTDHVYNLSQQLNRYDSMFENTSSLLDLTNYLTFNPTNNYSNLFKNCVSLSSINIQEFYINDEKLIFNSMFENCQNLSSLINTLFYKYEQLTYNFVGVSGETITSSVVQQVYYNDILPSTTISCKAMFKDCINLIEIPQSIKFNQGLIDCTSAFQNCQTLKSADITLTNTAITACTYLFDNCINLTTISENFLFSTSASIIDYMFNNCYALTGINPDIELYDIISSANYTFNNCSSLVINTLYSGLNVYKLIEANYLFNNVPIGTLYNNFLIPSSGNKLDNMFGNIPNLSYNISNIWYTYDAQGEGDYTTLSAVETCSGTLLNNANISGHAPSKYLWYNQFIDFNNPLNYFKGCTDKINNYNLIPEEWGGPAVSGNGYSIHNTIFNVTNNTTDNITFQFKATNASYYSYISTSGLTSLIPPKQTIYIEEITNTIIERIQIPAGDTYQIRIKADKIKITSGKPYITKVFSLGNTLVNCDGMFKDCSRLVQLDARCSMTKSMESAVSMFENCTALTEIPSTFHLGGQVSSFANCFKGCTNLTTIKSEFEFSHNTQNVCGMFENTGLNTIPNSLYITSGITDASRMFFNCNSLKELPEGFRFSQNIPSGNINVSQMFANCTNLIRIQNKNFELPCANNFYRMFYNCPELNTDITHIFTQKLYNYFNSLPIDKKLDMREMFAGDELLYGIPDAAYLWFLDKHYLSGETVFNFENCFYGCISLFNFIDIPLYWGGRDYPPEYTVLRISPNKNDNTQQIFNIIPLDGISAKIIWGDNENNISQIPGNENIQIISAFTQNISHTYALSADTTVNVNIPYGVPTGIYENNKIGGFAEYKEFPNYSDYLDICPKFEEPNKFEMYYRIHEAKSNYYKSFKTIILKNVKTFNLGQFNNHLITIFNIGKNIESCYEMFANSKKLVKIYQRTSIPHYASDCSRMFYNCTELTELHQNFQLGLSTRYINSMFENCMNLINIHSFHINQKIEQLDSVFKNCYKLCSTVNDIIPIPFKNTYRDYRYIDHSNSQFSWDNIVINMRNAFENCQQLSGVISANVFWNNSEQIIDGKNAFKGINKYKIENSYLIPEQWGGENIFSFYIIKSSLAPKIQNGTVTNLKDDVYRISGNNLTSLKISNLDKLSYIQLIQIGNTIQSCQSLFKNFKGKLTISQYFVFPSSLINCFEMFANCTGLTDLPSTFKLSIFGKINNNLNLSGISDIYSSTVLDTSINYSNMFAGCYNLSADITNVFDNIVYSFEDNTQFIDKVNIGNMFSGCTNIVGTVDKRLLCTMKDIQINAFASCTKLANWQFIPKRFGGRFEKDIYPEDTIFKVNLSDGITLINNSQQQITIDWGDGIISYYTSGTIQHNYSDIKEERQFLVIVKNAINLVLSGNASIIQIIQLGSNLETYQNMFANCFELTELFTPYIQFKPGLNMDNMFNGCSKLSANINTLFDKDFYALSMNNTFSNCSNLFGLLYPIWESTQYYSHQNTFTGCTELFKQNKFIPFSWFNKTVNTYENNIPENINDDQTVFSIHLNNKSTNITLNNIRRESIAVPSGYGTKNIQKSKTIYLESSGYINWGDGITSIISMQSIKHTYASSGDYIIRLSGITQFTFNNNEYLTDVFAINKYTQNLDNTFENCINLQTVPSGLFNYPWCKSAKSLFKNCYSINGISNIDYQHSKYLEFIDSAFENCQNLSDAFSVYKLPNSVISINNLFKNTKINTLNENFVLNERLIQTSKAFNNCIKLSGNNILLSSVISKFNVDSSYMFKNCSGLLLDLTNRFTDLTTYVYRPIYVNVTEMFKNCFSIYGVIPAAKLWNNDLNMFIPYNCFENCLGINNINNIPIIWGGKAEWYLDQKISVFELTIPQPDGTPYRMTQEFNNVKSATNDFVYINWDWNYTSETAILPSAISKWTKYNCSTKISEIVPIDNGYNISGKINNSGIFLSKMTDQPSGLCNKIMPNNINWALDTTLENDGDSFKYKSNNNYYPYKYLTRIYYDAGKTISHTYTKAGKYTILVYNASTFGTELGKTKITDVIQLSNQLTRYTNVLRGSGITDLSKSRITLPSAITDTAYMFAQCQHLTKLPKQFKLHGNISTIQGMFAKCDNLSLDIAELFNDFDSRKRATTNINTFNFIKFKSPVVYSNWPNMTAAFAYCKSIYGTVPFDKLCYSNNDAVLAATMFKDCINLNNYNLIPKNWGGPFISNNSLVIKYDGAAGPAGKRIKLLKILSKETFNKGLCKFKQYSLFGKLDNTYTFDNENIVSGIIGKETVPHYMVFENCLPDLSTLDKSKITELIQFPKHCQAISNYFENCTNLSSISEAVVLAGYSYPRMFAGCTSLTTIPDSFVLSPYITNANGMFARCSNLTTVNMKKLFENIDKIDISNIFDGCTSLTGVVPIQLLESKSNISADNAFLNCSKLLNYNNIPSNWR